MGELVARPLLITLTIAGGGLLCRESRSHLLPRAIVQLPTLERNAEVPVRDPRVLDVVAHPSTTELKASLASLAPRSVPTFISVPMAARTMKSSVPLPALMRTP